MPFGRFLRRSIARPIYQRIDTQSRLICEMHVQQLLSSAPYNEPNRLERHGFSSFSQNDEDGIIQEIFRRIGTRTSTFVEVGVGRGLQNNTRLLLYRGWRGLWIEGNRKYFKAIQRTFESETSAGQLKLAGAFVTKDNIRALLASAGVGDDLDLLSIDIDGNDYWVWEAVPQTARVVVIEYNAKFRPPTEWVMQYDAQHRWNGTDYHGASLESLSKLGRRKGYALVGCCLAGVNAFFVRDDLVADHFPTSDIAALYNPPRFHLNLFMPVGHRAGAFGKYCAP